MQIISKTPSTLSKRNLLSGNFQGNKIPKRPPWAIDEILFDDACNHCGDCIDICPSKIISFARGKLPIVDFTKGACTFCGECESSCTSNALDQSKQNDPWQLKALISNDCLTQRHVTCRSCEDPCPEYAITFKLALGGMATPLINIKNCTGCGACLATCPTQAIHIN